MSSNFKIISREEFDDSIAENSIGISVVDDDGRLLIGLAAGKKDKNVTLVLTAMTGIALANKIIDAYLFIAEERNKDSYKPIETAPKDGRKIIVADNYQATSAFWDSRGFWNAAEKIEEEPVPLPDTICYWKELTANSGT